MALAIPSSGEVKQAMLYWMVSRTNWVVFAAVLGGAVYLYLVSQEAKVIEYAGVSSSSFWKWFWVATILSLIFHHRLLPLFLVRP